MHHPQMGAGFGGGMPGGPMGGQMGRYGMQHQPPSHQQPHALNQRPSADRYGAPHAGGMHQQPSSMQPQAAFDAPLAHQVTSPTNIPTAISDLKGDHLRLQG